MLVFDLHLLGEEYSGILPEIPQYCFKLDQIKYIFPLFPHI